MEQKWTCNADNQTCNKFQDGEELYCGDSLIL